MSATRSLFGRACGVCVCVAVFVLALAPVADAADSVLFPAALHITRELSDPISQKTSVVDEFCQGNRIVSVSGKRTAIADYGRSELTEIDFAAGTYSITKFEQLARAYAQDAPVALQASAAARNEWRVASKGGSVIASRPVETIEAEKKDDHSRRVIRVSADRQLTLNRTALEALLGIGYPYPHTDSEEMMLGALRAHEPKITTQAAAATDEYHLPLEQLVRHEMGGETFETRNVVVRIGHELPPLDALAIPPGAKLVESKTVAARKLLEELDRPTHSGN